LAPRAKWREDIPLGVGPWPLSMTP